MEPVGTGKNVFTIDIPPELEATIGAGSTGPRLWARTSGRYDGKWQGSMRNGRRMPGPRRIDGHKVWDVRELDLCFDDFPRADAFDYHCPLLSLPLALQATLETILAESQYLRAARDCELLGRPPKTKPRIGLVWSGSTVFRFSLQMLTGYACRRTSEKRALQCFGKTVASHSSGTI